MDSKIIKKLFVIFLLITTQVEAVEFKGKFIQGHFILGKTLPNAIIIIDKKKVKVSKDGYFAFGIKKDRKLDIIIIEKINSKTNKIVKKILKRNYKIQRIDGLPEKSDLPYILFYSYIE